MITRRRFLLATGALAATHWSRVSGPGLIAADQTNSASKLVAGKSDELLVLSSEPKVLETPVHLLAKDTLTSTPLLFVRNNAEPAGTATCEPASANGWNVELTGLVEGKKSIAVESLAKLPHHEVEMVLQCSGNSRAMFSRAAQTSGTQWGRGGIGNVKFGGVKLTAVLEHLQATPQKLARYVCAEGQDAPMSDPDDFEHSLPLGDALEGAMLATTLNGQPLPAVHGGPVRLVLPGYYGTVQMKWLNRLRFEAEESANAHHADRYRTPNRLIEPGASFKFDRSNSTPTWKQKIASLVTSNADLQQLAAGSVRLQGYAWNDGSVPLAGVLLSTDQGETWRRVSLNAGASPFAWSQWSASVEIQRGENRVWVSAVDVLGRTQPLDGNITWNPRGYEWNGVERLTLIGT